MFTVQYVLCLPCAILFPKLYIDYVPLNYLQAHCLGSDSNHFLAGLLQQFPNSNLSLLCYILHTASRMMFLKSNQIIILSSLRTSVGSLQPAGQSQYQVQYNRSLKLWLLPTYSPATSLTTPQQAPTPRTHYPQLSTPTHSYSFNKMSTDHLICAKQ